MSESDEREWLPEDESWEAYTGDRLCSRPHCGRPAVMMLYRTTFGLVRHGRREWCCADPAHSYGRRVNAGRVEALFLPGTSAYAEAKLRITARELTKGN